MGCFEQDREKIFTPKELEKVCKVEAKKVRTILAKLLRQKRILRISRGKYRHPKPSEPESKDNIKRYITTLEKTCEIAVYELMLTEPLVGKKDTVEIEHQIAYFARHLVKARWALDKGSLQSIDIDEEIFKRAKKIHEWSKFVFEESRAKKK